MYHARADESGLLSFFHDRLQSSSVFQKEARNSTGCGYNVRFNYLVTLDVSSIFINMYPYLYLQSLIY